MNILAIDTALTAASACVMTQGEAEPVAGETYFMERGHAEALLPLIDRIMARLDGGFAGLGRVAVTVGPGSFTGIRVGIATARAIGLACSIPVVGISTLAGLAASLRSWPSGGSVAVAAIDARHGNVFFQPFDAAGAALAPPRLASLPDAAAELGAGPFRMTGPGAALLAAEAQRRGLRADVVGNRVAPDIALVARLGLEADPSLAEPRPLYLKAPDAHPQTEGRVARA